MTFERLLRVLLRGVPNLRDTSDAAVRGYLSQMLRNVFVDMLRRQKRDPVTIGGEPAEEESATEALVEEESLEEQTERLKELFVPVEDEIALLDAEVTANGSNALKNARRQLEHLRDNEDANVNVFVSPGLTGAELKRARDRIFGQHKHWRKRMRTAIEQWASTGRLPRERVGPLERYLVSLWQRRPGGAEDTLDTTPAT